MMLKPCSVSPTEARDWLVVTWRHVIGSAASSGRATGRSLTVGRQSSGKGSSPVGTWPSQTFTRKV
eukprot:9123996-Pyramimonas_sp.AAC.1